MQRKKGNDGAPDGIGKRQSTRTMVVSRAMQVVSAETRQEVRDKRIQQLECDNYNEEQETAVDDDAYVESDEDNGAAHKKKKIKSSKQNIKNNTVRPARVARKVRNLDRIVMEENYTLMNNANNSSSNNSNNSSSSSSSNGRNSGNSFGGSSSSSSSSGKRVSPYEDMDKEEDSTEYDGNGNSNNNGYNDSSSSNNHTSNNNHNNGNRHNTNDTNDSNNNNDNNNNIEGYSSYPSYSSITADPSSKPTRHFCSVCGYIGQYSCTRCGLRYCCHKCLTSHKDTRCMKVGY